MRDFRDKVAVVTGGAGGIGFEMARQLAGEGMKIVLADVRDEPLQKAAEGLRAQAAKVITTTMDVSKAQDVEALLAATLSAFGGVHVLCNVAAVSTRTLRLHEASQAAWEWVLGVNVWGALHAIRLFTPVMIAQGVPGHIVNFSSAAGLSTAHGLYGVSKHMIAAVSEALYRDLRETGTQIGVSVVFPGPVKTELVANSQAVAPDDVKVGATSAARGGDVLARGLSAADLVARVIDGIRNDVLYVVMPERYTALARARAAAIVAGRAPDLPQVDALWRTLHATES
jgi:NAD(P)-dependent dehydrogenase (short-subunit alcohol dehydrogenase family)